MYFDPRPKTRGKDLFGRNNELKEFKRFIDARAEAPVIIVTGPRRSGKTSFLNVALAGSNQPYMIMDMRGMTYNASYAEIIRVLENAFNKINRKKYSSIVNAIKHVRGVEAPVGGGITLSWDKPRVNLMELFDQIDEWANKKRCKFLVAFDEIQLVRGNKWLLQFFAHVADTNRNVIIVLTGSEVGLLFDFLSFNEPDTPLYGRHHVEIPMKHFEPGDAKRFLEAGFRQAKLHPKRELTDYAVSKLDGVVGWLTLFGTKCIQHDEASKGLVDKTLYEAGRLARQEALKLVERSQRDGAILNFLSIVENAGWTQIRKLLASKEGRVIHQESLARRLEVLINVGFVEKNQEKYSIADPILKRGIHDNPLPEGNDETFKKQREDETAEEGKAN